MDRATLTARIAAFEAEMAAMEIKGGRGSGNWGHGGRPGKRGGSSSRGMGAQSRPGGMAPAHNLSDRPVIGKIRTKDVFGGPGESYEVVGETTDGASYITNTIRDDGQAQLVPKSFVSKFSPAAGPQAKPGVMQPRRQFAKGSAGEKYETHRQAIVDNVSRTKDALSRFIEEQKKDAKNWGYAGSLAGLAEHLYENGITVPHPPRAKTADEAFKNRVKQVKKQLGILGKVKPADNNTTWPAAGDVGRLAEISKEAMTYLIDEDTL